MKTFALTLLLLSSIACAFSAFLRPVAGKPFTLMYDPSVSGILLGATQISVVYVFDYWGTKVVQKLKGEGQQEDMFQNVLYPDEGRTTEVKMVRDGRLWKAEILIPRGAALLSYYFTDGTRSDYNDRRTVHFVHLQ